MNIKTNLFKGLCIVGFYVVVVPAVLATSLWDESANGGRSFYSDRHAFRVGDLVTIVVNQATTAAKDQSTKTAKTTSVTDQLTAFLGPFMGGERAAAELLRRNPHNAWNSADTYDGNGKLNNSETMTSTIQARVTDVMPNKVLRVEATRRIDITGEKSDLVLTGFVRQEDLTTANTILSTQVADLQLKQVTNGEVSRSQKKGWLTRVWENVSPF
jgi:flagellar L-ring protein precursor FlgH